MGISKKYHITQLKLLGIVLFVISIFMLVIFNITISNEQNKLIENEKSKIYLEIDLISDFINDSMIKGDYSNVRNFLKNWSENKEHIVSLKATFKNNFTLLDHQKAYMKESDLISVEKKMDFVNNYLNISITKDISHINTMISSLKQNMTFVSIFIVLSLGTLLWYILSKVAIAPMNEEIESQTNELKRVNNSLEVAKNNAWEAAKLAQRANKAKSEFLANMSHEIRTPMNAILGFSELLPNSPLDEKQKNYVDGIKVAAKNLLNIINDILDLSKIESGKMDINVEPVDIKTLIKEFETIFSFELEKKGIEFIIDIDEKLPSTLLIDETRLRQIIFNLMGNAVKFTHKGYVELKVYSDLSKQDESMIELIIEVKDSGIGIGNEQQKSIFEPFIQQDGQSTRQYGGTGLGLTITKKLIELMSGKISLESQIDKGSTFKISIPSIAVSSFEIKQNKQKEYEYSFDQNITILIVEDVITNREVVKGYLEDQNISIIEAENGKEGVDLAIALHPNLIFMDIQMPVMDGYQAIDILKFNPETKNIPIVALTASAMSSDEDKIKTLCDGYLRKPVYKEQLLDEMAKFLKHKKRKIKTKKEKQIKKDSTLIPKDMEIFKSSFKDSFFDTKELLTNNEVKSFAQDLLIFSQEYKDKELENYAKELISLAESFKLDSMEREFLKLEKLFD